MQTNNDNDNDSGNFDVSRSATGSGQRSWRRDAAGNDDDGDDVECSTQKVFMARNPSTY